MQIANESGWIKVNSISEIPTNGLFYAYCEYEDVRFRRSKRASLLKKMFLAGQLTHFKPDDTFIIDAEVAKFFNQL